MTGGALPNNSRAIKEIRACPINCTIHDGALGAQGGPGVGRRAGGGDYDRGEPGPGVCTGGIGVLASWI